jgi:heme-degrading monooxygenase HmoA
MTVKVLVERWVRAGYEDLVWHRLMELRGEAVKAAGYRYSETWRSVDNPRVLMVLSVWASREHWERWAQGPFRLGMEALIAPLLRRPSKVRVFEDAEGPAPVLVSRRRRTKVLWQQ